MTWVFSHSTAAGADRLLLLAIADHAGDDGGDAWPSVPTLARKTGVSERSVQRGISRLEAGGLLVVERGQGRRGTNLYRVVMAPPAGGDELSPVPSPGGDGPRCQPVTGDNVAPVTQRRHRGGDTQVSPERPERPSPPLPPAGDEPPATSTDRPPPRSRAVGTNPRAVRAGANLELRLQQQVDRLAERSIVQRAIASCGDCSAAGYLPSGRVCDHDPDAADRAARGLQLIRAELARAGTQGRGADGPRARTTDRPSLTG